MRYLSVIYDSNLRSCGFHEVGSSSKIPGPALALHSLLFQGASEQACLYRLNNAGLNCAGPLMYTTILHHPCLVECADMELRTGRADCKVILRFFILQRVQAPNPCALFEGHLYSFPSASPRVMWYIWIQTPQEEACGPRSCLWLDAQPPGPASGSPSSLQISTPLSNSAFIRSETLMLVSPRAGLLCLSLSGFTLRLASTCIISDTSHSFSHMMGGLFLTSASFNRYCKKKTLKSLPYSNVWLPSYLPCESQGLSLPCPVGL